MRTIKSLFLHFLLLASATLSLQAQSKEWPVLKHYDQDHINKIALPIGGIGTGTISLGGTGDLRDWEIMNRPAKGFTGVPIGNRAPFFAIYTSNTNGDSKTKGLMGPVNINLYESKDGTGVNSHGIPRFRNCTFDAAYPLGQANFEDENLFNGEYYIQKIQPPSGKDDISPYLLGSMGSKDLKNPDFQLGEGCLVDQLVGQYMAHICDMGYLTEPEHVKTTLQSIMKYNYRPSLYDHFNNMRSFALGDEAALLMASFPHTRPEVPFPYWSEVMTGFEYTAAVGMLYEGQTENGLKVIKNVRDRYDGKKRRPFDEAECGHHYARAMAAYAEVLALTGFFYSGVERILKFNPVEGKYFWANGNTWGTIEQKRNGNAISVKLSVLGDNPLAVNKYELRGFGSKKLKDDLKVTTGKTLNIEIKQK